MNKQIKLTGNAIHFYLCGDKKYVRFCQQMYLMLCTISDEFTHRPNRPWPRAPRFWGPALLIPMKTHY